ncbi:MAG: Segregation and condensation protein B [candidate division BRC1 bacterium ADurb.BinA364]|nr:MAG: Segregation and condensation protein B [candidate division BRC1 bacterium ADurb.BinA364]
MESAEDRRDGIPPMDESRQTSQEQGEPAIAEAPAAPPAEAGEAVEERADSEHQPDEFEDFPEPDEMAVPAPVESVDLPEAADPALEDDEAGESALIEDLGEAPEALQDSRKIKAALEAMLFASGDPITARRLGNALNLSSDQVREHLAEMTKEFEDSGRGLLIAETAEGYQLSTRGEYADWILRLLRHKRRSPLSPAALETLAIIAYKQPIIRADVDAIRGVESGGVIRTLVDLGLIEIAGRKEVLGRPQLYATTDAFLRAFGLKKIEDLPSIQQLREKYRVGGGS